MKNTDTTANEFIIKSARIFQKQGFINIDYRLESQYRLKGKDRVRFSTGEAVTRRALQRIERDKFSLAQSHYSEHEKTTDGSLVTLDDIALKALREDRHNRANDTQKDMETIYEMFIKPKYKHTLLEDIKVSDVKEWKTKLLTGNKLSRSRFIKYFRVFNTILNFGEQNEIISRNVCNLVDKKSKLFAVNKKSLEEKYYTATEVEKMLSNSTGWFRVMLMTYLNTGMRTGEGLALQWKDIDFKNRTITIQRSIRKGKLKEGTKTNGGRVIRMSLPLHDALLEYKEYCNSRIWLFPNPKTGKPYYEANSITKWYFKPLLNRCNIDYRQFYSLRHTFASLSIQKNIPMPIVQKMLGHSDLNTTLKFYVKHDLLAEKNDIDIFDKLYV